MTQASGLLERDAEVATLVGLVDALAGPGDGGAVLIEGPAGIGKSSLLRALVGAARERGDLLALTARGSELELELAFGGVRQLFAPILALPASDRDALLSGPAALAASVLGLRDAPAGEFADPLYALAWLVTNLAERSPVLIALDDMHWLDAESGRFVAYLAQRIEGLPVLLAATARPREPGAMAHPLDVVRQIARVVTPSPLSPAASAAVVGGAATADEAHRVTGGNPFLLTELARALERAAPGTALERLDMQAVAHSLARGIERISPAAAALADAVALFPAGTRLSDAARLAGLPSADAASAADALIDAHVLADQETALEFLHPLLRSARYDALGRFARRRGHAVAAEVLSARGAPAEEVAAHLLAGEPAGSAEHAAILREAADAAIAAVAPRAAVRYLARALDEGASPPDEQRAMRLDLGRLQRLVGDADAQATLTAAFEASGGTPDHARAAIELAATAFSNSDSATVHRTVAAARDGDLTGDERIVLEMLRAETLWAELEFETCLELIDRVPKDLPGETAAQRMALGMAASVRFMRGDPVEEVMDMLRRSVGVDGISPSPVAGLDVGDPLQWMVQAGALDEAQALAEERMTHARETGDEALYAGTQNAYGWLLDLRGDLRGATAAFRLGLAQPAITPFMRQHVTMNLAHTLVASGELDEALAAIASVEEGAPRQLAHLLGVRRAQVALWRGDYEAALGPLERLYEISSRVMRNPHALPLAPEYADALAGAGRRDDAVAITRELVAASERFEGVFGKGVHRATLGRLTGDVGELERAVAVLASSPYRWYEARARLDLGRALRRDGRRADSREHLRLALDYSERNGATLLAAQAHEELRLAGARPRSVVLTGADALTPAEARIARLAADGMANKEIAAHLFVTVGTVQTTLVRVYRKLDVGSRRDLAGALASG
jgi:DNA-binding CsgD family transcriptional regulator